MKMTKVLAGTLAALTAGATMTFGIFAAGLGDYVSTGTVGGYNALSSPMIVVGSSVPGSDVIGAADIAAAVAGYATTTVSSGTNTVAVSGGADLSTGDSKLYMGSAVTKVRNTLTSSSLPSVLASGSLSVSGTSYTYDQYLVLGSGAVTYGTITAANELDPILYVSLNSGSTGANTGPLYNTTVVFSKPLNVTDSNVRGQTISLFGKDYTIGSTSGTTNSGYNPLELFGYGASQNVYHNQEATVNIGGTEYKVKALINTNQQVLIYVNSVADSSWRTSGASTVVNGLNVYVKGVGYISSTDLTQNFAQLSLGSQKLTLTDGSAVTVGSDTSIDGTLVDIIGGADGISSLAISVASTDSTTAYIQAGEAFTDPVYGSFKVAFNGLTPGVTDTSRDILTSVAGTTQASVSFNDGAGNAKTLNWALAAASNNIALNASASQAIIVVENATVNQNDYFLFAPSQESEFGHLFRLSSMSGISGSAPKFTLEDVTKGTSTTYTLPTNAWGKTIYVDGQAVYAYNKSTTSMSFSWGSSAGVASVGSSIVAFPLVKLKGGEFMTFLSNTTLTRNVNHELPGNATVNVSTTHLINDSIEAVTAGRITYTFMNSSTTGFYLKYVNTSAGTLLVDEFPAILILQEQDNATNKNTVTIEAYERDSTNHYVGLREPVYSDGTTNVQWSTDVNMKSGVDLFGTYVTYSAPSGSGQTAKVYYPDSQAVATVGVGTDPVFSGAAGSVQSAVKIQNPVAKFANEVSETAPGAHVILVGGPCANSLTAKVLAGEGITCDNWATKVGGSGSALIKEVTGAFTDGKKALVIAGTDAADTRAAAKKVMQGTLSLQGAL